MSLGLALLGRCAPMRMALSAAASVRRVFGERHQRAGVSIAVTTASIATARNTSTCARDRDIGDATHYPLRAARAPVQGEPLITRNTGGGRSRKYAPTPEFPTAATLAPTIAQGHGNGDRAGCTSSLPVAQRDDHALDLILALDARERRRIGDVLSPTG